MSSVSQSSPFEPSINAASKEETLSDQLKEGIDWTIIAKDEDDLDLSLCSGCHKGCGHCY